MLPLHPYTRKMMSSRLWVYPTTSITFQGPKFWHLQNVLTDMKSTFEHAEKRILALKI